MFIFIFFSIMVYHRRRLFFTLFFTRKKSCSSFHRVLDLIDEGYDVIVAGDCVSSRKRYTRDTAMALMAEAGATISAYESILFDLLLTAADPHFKAISKIVK